MAAPQIPAWAARYIGIPFVDLGRDERGCDCWGLARLILRTEAGIDLPSFEEYDGTGHQDIPRIAALIDAGLQSGIWHEIAPGSEKPLDGILIRKRGLPTHTGIVLVPGLAIHTVYGAGAIALEYGRPLTRHKVIAFYRHNLLA